MDLKDLLEYYYSLSLEILIIEEGIEVSGLCLLLINIIHHLIYLPNGGNTNWIEDEEYEIISKLQNYSYFED